MKTTQIIITLIVLLLIGVWYWLKNRQSKKMPMAEPATQTPVAPVAENQTVQEAMPESQNTSAEVIHLSSYTQAPEADMSTAAESAAPAIAETQMPPDGLNYVLSPDDAESLASPSATETTFNSPAPAPVAPATVSHHSGTISMIPEDSTLRRHFFCQLKAEFESQFEPKPTDSTLKRHYETEINSKFTRYLAENQ